MPVTQTNVFNANLILDALDEGALTVKEITALTALNGRIVRRNLRGLAAADLIETLVSDEADEAIWQRTARKRKAVPAKAVRRPRKAIALPSLLGGSLRTA